MEGCFAVGEVGEQGGGFDRYPYVVGKGRAKRRERGGVGLECIGHESEELLLGALLLQSNDGGFWFGSSTYDLCTVA